MREVDLLDGNGQSRLQSSATIVPVREMARSISFYEKLGFLCELYEDGESYAFLSRDEQQLHLNLMATPEFQFNPLGVYFYVDDVDVLYDELVAAGIQCIHAPEDKPWRMREFAVSDPDSALLRFGERSPGP